MQKKSIALIIFAAGIFLVASCKKEDKSNPVIEIRNPLAGQQFKAGDTVFVSAAVAANNQLTSVTVGLLNSNYVSVDHTVSVPVSGNNANVNVRYAIENENLASDNYMIVITASDGQTETHGYVTIHISEIPKTRKGIYFLSASNNSTFHVSTLDSLNQPHFEFNVNGDYSGSLIHSRSHELFTIGKITGALNVFDLDDKSLLWTRPATSTNVPTFQNLFIDQNMVYIGYYDGNIIGYDNTGAQLYQVQQQGYFIPDVLLKNNNYVFAELYYTSSHQHKIGVYYLGSGLEKQEQFINSDMLKMFSLDDDNLILFGNDTVTGDGTIEKYSIPGNGINSQISIPGKIIFDVARISNNHYLLATSDGIYSYSYPSSGVTPFATGYAVYSLEYDELNSEVFAAAGNSIHTYDLTTASEKYFVITADSVMDVRVLYNK